LWQWRFLRFLAAQTCGDLRECFQVNQTCLLWHEYETAFGDVEGKLVGVYRTEEDARRAIDRYVLLPGFRDYPDGFSVQALVPNEEWWSDGFVLIVNDDEKAVGSTTSLRPPGQSRPAGYNALAAQHRTRQAPDGYWIYEIFQGEQSLGCEVGRIGNSEPLASGIGLDAARKLALGDSIG
jgi:homoserine kinase type II